MQYIYNDHFRGQPRKLLILVAAEGMEYRVFNGADFMGSIRLTGEERSAVWKSEYNQLKPLVSKIVSFMQEATTA